MPRYDTRCTSCGAERELILTMTQDLPTCDVQVPIGEFMGETQGRRCGGKLEKIPATTAFSLKGGGWTPRLTGGRTE